MARTGVEADIVTYNSMVNAYIQANQLDEAVAVVDEMVERGVPVSEREVCEVCEVWGV